MSPVMTIAAVCLVTTAMPAVAPRTARVAASPARFIGVRDFSRWTRETDARPGEAMLTSRNVDPGLAWDELIVSWDADTPAGTGIRVEARALYADHATKWYTLGLWTADSGVPAFEPDAPVATPGLQPRESVRGQKDADGDVKTDTLVLNEPAAKAQVRVTLVGGVGDAAAKPTLRFVGMAFLDSKGRATPTEPNRRAWGKTIEVPERAQGAYPHGAVICSATCTSMMLSYWAKDLHRPELDKDVPEVCAGVYDPVFDGTGNWPFNTAYAGSMQGMRAYVSRFTDISELEDWIAAGLPVVCSVSYTALRGRNVPDPSGHLVICVGFTDTGDVILNDPALNPARGLRVRTPYPRDRFLAGWADSKNTVYLIYPEGAKLPKDRFGHWSGQ